MAQTEACTITFLTCLSLVSSSRLRIWNLPQNGTRDLHVSLHHRGWNFNLVFTSSHLPANCLSNPSCSLTSTSDRGRRNISVSSSSILEPKRLEPLFFFSSFIITTHSLYPYTLAWLTQSSIGRRRLSAFSLFFFSFSSLQN